MLKKSGIVLFGILLIGLAGSLFSSCSRPDYSAQIAALDSVLIKVDSAYNRFREVDCGKLQGIQDSVEKHLGYVQTNYSGPMRRDMADHLGKYRTIRKLVAVPLSRSQEAERAIVMVRKQIGDLRLALTDGSTHDALGNKLTPDYITKQIARETEAASALTKEMNLIAERGPLMEERYTELYPRVRFWVDSIPLKTEEDLFR